MCTLEIEFAAFTQALERLCGTGFVVLIVIAYSMNYADYLFFFCFEERVRTSLVSVEGFCYYFLGGMVSNNGRN